MFLSYQRIRGAPLSEENTILCPVCDAEIPDDSGKCPVCGVDLSLFDLEKDIDGVEAEESLDNMLNLLKDDLEEEDLIEKIKMIGNGNNFVGAESEKEVSIDEKEVEEVLVFECPICGADVAEDATICPGCGAEFEEEEIDDEEEMENAVKRAKEILTEVRQVKLGIKPMKDNLRKVVKAKNDGRYKECMGSLEVMEDQFERIIDLSDMIDVGKEKVKELKERGHEFKPYITELRKAKNLVDKGQYEKAATKLDETVDDIIEYLEKDVEEEEKKKGLKNELDEGLKKLKEEMTKAKKTSIKIEPLKRKAKKAIQARKESDYEKGMKGLEEAMEATRSLMETNENLEKVKSKIKEMRKKGIEYKPFMKQLKEGKNRADEGEYNKAGKTFERLIQEINSEIERFESEISELEKKAEKKVKELEQSVNQLEEGYIAYSHILGLFDDCKKLYEENKFQDSIDTSNEAQDKIKKVIRVSILSEESASRIDELSKGGEDINRYESVLEEAKKEAEQGKIDSAIDKLEQNIEDLETELEELERKVTVEDIERTVKELRNLLITARKNGVKVKGGKRIIEEAVKSTAKKDLEHTMELLLEGKDTIIDTITYEIDERVMNAELALEEETTTSEDKIESLMEKIKETLENGEYIEGLKISSELNDLLKEKKEEDTRDKMVKSEEVPEEELLEIPEEDFAEKDKDIETIEEVPEEELLEIPEEEEEIDLSKWKMMVETGEKIGFETSTAKELISKAEKSVDMGEFEKALKDAEDAKTKLIEQVPERLKPFLKDAQAELRKAKISGEDISDAINLLKEASYAREDGELEECFNHMIEYRKMMNDID